ncbi:MAG: ponA (ponA) [Acidobacteriaceae bacterium]|nr:ponA (ponA) [Acidobacteriaceae bacterium]
MIAATVLMVLAVLLIGRMLFSSGDTSSVAATSSPAASSLPVAPPARVVHVRPGAQQKAAHVARSLDPTLRYDWLKASEDTEYRGKGRNIFRAEAEIPKIIQPPVTSQKAPDSPAPPPPPPPINIKFFGFANKPGESKKIFLSQGEDVFIAAEGDIVDRRYKVLRITPMSVEIEDVLNNNRQSIPLTQG